MDNLPANPLPNLLSTPFYRNKLFLIVFIILAIIIILAGIIFWLRPNLPFLKTSPKEIHVALTAQNQQLPSPKPDQAGPFACPSVVLFCQQAKEITVNGSEVGMGAKVATGSAVFAAFEGDIEATTAAITNPSSKTATQQVIILDLKNKEKLLRARYIFNGTTLDKTRAKEGEQIGQVGKELMPLYSNSSLLFTLTYNDTTMGQRLDGITLKLKSSNFKTTSP